MSGDLAPPAEFKRVNRVLAALTILSTGWALYGTFWTIRRYLGMPRPFNSPFPIERHETVAAVLVTLCVTCLYRTGRAPDRSSTVYLNVAGVVVPLAWWILLTSVFYVSVLSMRAT